MTKSRGIGRGNHPNSRKNLLVCPKGVSTNPRGSSKKVRERKEIRSRIEACMERHDQSDVAPFTQEEALAWYEYLHSLTPQQFFDVATDKDLPFGAIKMAKLIRSDFQEGSDRNCDKLERRYYGSKNNIDVSGKLDTSEDTTLATLGLVFGGERLTPDE